MTVNGVANFPPQCHKTQIHSHTYTHTRLYESHPKLHDSVRRSHSSLIYRRQNNNTPESLSISLALNVSMCAVLASIPSMCQIFVKANRIDYGEWRAPKLKSKLNGKHKYELSSLGLILKRIDEQNLRVTMLKAPFCAHLEWHSHTNTQWQMVDSTCVYSLWFFPSFRFKCLAMWLQ